MESKLQYYNYTIIESQTFFLLRPLDSERRLPDRVRGFRTFREAFSDPEAQKGFRVSSLGSLGFRVSSLGFRKFGVKGVEFRDWCFRV